MRRHTRTRKLERRRDREEKASEKATDNRWTAVQVRPQQ